MAQAKVISEQELKRALGMVTGRKHAARDRLALLLTHWASYQSVTAVFLQLAHMRAWPFGPSAATAFGAARRFMLAHLEVHG